MATVSHTESSRPLAEGEREFFESTRPLSEEDAHPPLSEKYRQLAIQPGACYSTVAMLTKALQSVAGDSDELAEAAGHVINVLELLVEKLAEMDAELTMY